MSAAAANGSGSPTDAAGRGARGKGKDREREKEDMVVPVMTEDEFELVMALMERWTDEKVPTLHTVRPALSLPLLRTRIDAFSSPSLSADLTSSLALQDVTRIPAFADMESVFSHPLPAPFFPNFVVPPSVPVPGILCRMAKAVYPHWKDRRILAEGKNIIPQLNVSPRLCGDLLAIALATSNFHCRTRRLTMSLFDFISAV